MKLLDLDMDYFMEKIAIGITESREDEYGYCVWSEQRIRSFLEDNSRTKKGDAKKLNRVFSHPLFFLTVSLFGSIKYPVP